MIRYVLIGGLIAFASPALTQDTAPTQYFVVQDLVTKKCLIVDKKPTSTTVSVVGSSVYKTWAEAESGMKAAAICSMT